MSWPHTSLFWQTVLQVVGLSGDFVGLYFGSLLVWKLLKRSRPKHAQRWMRFLEKWTESKKDMRGWIRANEFPIALLFVSGMTCILAYGAIANRYPVATYHDVIVLPKNEYGDWPMRSTEDASIMFRPCSDFNIEPILKQAADEGWIIYQAKWQQRPTCQDIYDQDYGFTVNYPDGSYKRRFDATTAAK